MVAGGANNAEKGPETSPFVNKRPMPGSMSVFGRSPQLMDPFTATGFARGVTH